MRKNAVIYAVYRDDKFIDLGTKEELAKKLKVTPSYIQKSTTPSFKKRYDKSKGNNHLIVIKIGKASDKI